MRNKLITLPVLFLHSLDPFQPRIYIFVDFLKKKYAEHDDRSSILTAVQYTHFKEHTVCPRSSEPSYIVSYYVNGVATFWTYRNTMWYALPFISYIYPGPPRYPFSTIHGNPPCFLISNQISQSTFFLFLFVSLSLSC